MLFISSFIFSIFIGFALAICITAFWVSYSNNHGTEKGEFENFSQHPVHFIEKKSSIRKPIL